MKVEAYSPAHITGLFKIYKKGSTGAGVNLHKGVKTAVDVKKAERNSIKVLINGRKAAVPASYNLVRKFLELKNGNYRIAANHKTELPIGYGLGLSGASALSLSLALNKALNAGLGKRECVLLAQMSEIEEGTGLGDVIAEQFSGLMIGKKPYPSTRVQLIPISERFVVCGFFAPIDTKKIIRSKGWKEKINAAGEKYMRELNKKKTLENFVRCSNCFSLETGLASKRIGKIIRELPDASMAMLGQTLFTITNNPKKAKRTLQKYTKRIAVSRIATKGADLL